ncbi:MAG TPA: efflux RND transporter periplasmic adaptor subunit [Cyclobacteriaceae bacterium]|nr:efflux RND transporter periplasmic adaptor subunit [Cyclobacteriaceae bacterium]
MIIIKIPHFFTPGAASGKFPSTPWTGLILILLLLTGGCSKKQAIVLPPAKVSVIKAIQTDVPIYEEFVAQVYGLSDVEIRTRVEGWVTAVRFKEGSVVQKGDLLYEIDDIQYKTRVDAAASDLAKANTEMVRAKNELDRVKPLTELNALSKQDLDNAEASYKAAVASAQAAKAVLENAQIELGYTKVRALIGGVIGISNARVGDYVSRASASSVLTTISDVQQVRVRFQISEREFLRIAKMTKEEIQKMRQIQLVLADGSLYPLNGTVDFANREIDPKTGTITVESTFMNPSGILRPGLFVKVRVLVSTYKGAVVIPQRAVFQLQSVFQVFSVTDSSTLKASMIETGPKSGEGWVVTKGLKAGDKVAIIGNAQLTLNSKIEEVPTAWPDSTATKK